MAERELLLLRHGKSSWDEPGLDDRERPLALRGERAAAAMGAYLAQRERIPDLVLCSPARRTRETWERLRLAFDAAPAVEMDEALYAATPRAILGRVRAVADEVGSLLVLGHNPGVAALAAELAGSGDPEARQQMGRKFPTAALAVLAPPEGPWSALKPGTAALLEFRTPKELV